MKTIEYETIKVERQGRVGLVTLNRPEQMNAYTWRMGRELQHVFNSLDLDDEVRAIVVTGAGGTADCAEGITSFLEKRDPEWKMSKHDLPESLAN